MRDNRASDLYISLNREISADPEQLLRRLIVHNHRQTNGPNVHWPSSSYGIQNLEQQNDFLQGLYEKPSRLSLDI